MLSEAAQGGGERQKERHAYVPPLRVEDTEEEEEEQDAGADPAVGFEGCCLVKVGLIYLAQSSVISCLRAMRSLERHHTRPNFEDCALTAAKGVSGSGASMLDLRVGGVGHLYHIELGFSRANHVNFVNSQLNTCAKKMP